MTPAQLESYKRAKPTYYGTRCHIDGCREHNTLTGECAECRRYRVACGGPAERPAKSIAAGQANKPHLSEFL